MKKENKDNELINLNDLINWIDMARDYIKNNTNEPHNTLKKTKKDNCSTTN